MINLVVIKKCFLVTCLLIMSGCTMLDQRPPEDVVLERAEAHLAALREGDFQTALDYTTPAFQQSARARRYGSMYSSAPMWRGAEIYAVECEATEVVERCTVRTRVLPFIAPHIQANIRDLPVSVSADWIYTERNWYRYEK